MMNGTYTIENRETHEHRTFRVRTQPDDAKFAPGSRIVSLLTGADNESDYTGFGFVLPNKVVVWRKKRSSVAGQLSDFEIYASMLWVLASNGDASRWSRKYCLHLSSTCIRCNRKLTTPESIIAGIGPECAAAVGCDRAQLVEAFHAAEAQAAQHTEQVGKPVVAGPVQSSLWPRAATTYRQPAHDLFNQELSNARRQEKRFEAEIQAADREDSRRAADSKQALQLGSEVLARTWSRQSLSGSHVPLDLDCPKVKAFAEELGSDELGWPVAEDRAEDFVPQHRRACTRCREYGLANVQ
jgi:hypothetical protein